MGLSFEEVNILGDLINDTFGKASTTSGYNSSDKEDDVNYGGYTRGGTGTATSVATKASMQGETLCVTSLCIVNLGPHGHQHQVINQTEGELNQHINSFMSNLKKQFKKKEHAGRALKTKEDKNKRTTDVQMINHYAETRQAYIYRRAFFEIG